MTSAQSTAKMVSMADPALEARVLLARLRKDNFMFWPVGLADVGYIGPKNTPELRDAIFKNKVYLNTLLVKERVALRQIPPSEEEPHGWLLRRGKHPYPALVVCGSKAWLDACMIATAYMRGVERDLWARVEHCDIVGDILRDDRGRLVATLRVSQSERVSAFVLDCCRDCCR